ncbi:MAG: LysR substrate-binding domain-containing protein [Oceanicaulis sp.]
MRPTLRQMQYIVAVAERGRFSEASRALHVSQPSLSAQIQEAEAALGAAVFERSRTGAILTPVGEEIVRRARLILRQVEDLHAVAAHGGAGLYGRLRMGVLPTVGPYLLPLATAAMHAAYPDLRLNIRDDRPDMLQDRLTDGRLDALISTPEEHPGAETQTLFTERLFACCADDDPLAQKRGPLDLGALKSRTLLTLGLGHRLTTLVHEIARRSGAVVSHEYEGTSLDAIRHMAGLGAGVAVMPELYVCCEGHRDDNVVFRPLDDDQAVRTIALCWRPESPLVDGFRELGALLSEAGLRALADA